MIGFETIGKVTIRFGAKAALYLAENGPKILSVASAVMVPVGMVWSGVAAIKINDILTESTEKLEKASPEEAKAIRRDAGTKIFKEAAGPVVIGAVTVGGIIASERIANAKYTTLMGAYTAAVASQNARRIVSDSTTDIPVGEGDEAVTEDSETYKHNDIEPSNTMGLYDTVFNRANAPHTFQDDPEQNYRFIRCVERDMTRRLRSRGYLFLNDVYDELGMERTQIGAIAGWMSGRGEDRVDLGIDWYLKPENRDLTSPNYYGAPIVLTPNVDGTILYNLIKWHGFDKED